MTNASTVKTPEPSLREQELIDRVSWFIQLRWLAFAGTLIGVFFLWHLFGMRFPLKSVIGTVLAILLYNSVFALAAQYIADLGVPSLKIMRVFANIQVLADLICLTLIIHFLGGVENFFVVFYFFHMVIASILFRRWNAYGLAIVAAILMNGMIWGEYFGIVPHYRYETIFGPSRVSSFSFNFIAGGILTASLFLAVYFASSITRRLRAREVEVESAYSDLQKVDEEKSYFMRRVSHELRSPLTAVQSYVKVLSEGFSDKVSDRQRDLLNKMDVRLSSLVDMVADLLRFSRLRVLERPRTVEHFNFEELVRQSCEFYLPWANEKAVNLKVQTEPAPVLAEKEGFRDAVSNLISNAIKYTPEGGEVSVSLETNSKRASLTVADTGIGISEKEKEGVFSEFFRASNAKEFTRSGTGLGLAITKRIVEIHGGSIRFESELNKGTRFEVSFPLTGPSKKANPG